MDTLKHIYCARKAGQQAYLLSVQHSLFLLVLSEQKGQLTAH